MFCSNSAFKEFFHTGQHLLLTTENSILRKYIQLLKMEPCRLIPAQHAGSLETKSWEALIKLTTDLNFNQ